MPTIYLTQQALVVSVNMHFGFNPNHIGKIRRRLQIKAAFLLVSAVISLFLAVQVAKNFSPEFIAGLFLIFGIVLIYASYGQYRKLQGHNQRAEMYESEFRMLCNFLGFLYPSEINEFTFEQLIDRAVNVLAIQKGSESPNARKKKSVAMECCFITWGLVPDAPNYGDFLAWY